MSIVRMVHFGHDICILHCCTFGGCGVIGIELWMMIFYSWQHWWYILYEWLRCCENDFKKTDTFRVIGILNLESAIFGPFLHKFYQHLWGQILYLKTQNWEKSCSIKLYMMISLTHKNVLKRIMFEAISYDLGKMYNFSSRQTFQFCFSLPCSVCNFDVYFSIIKSFDGLLVWNVNNIQLKHQPNNF